MLYVFLAWSPVVKNLRQVVKYAIYSEISSGFARDQKFHLVQVLPFGTHLSQVITWQQREIVMYKLTDCPNLRPTRIRVCKKQQSLPNKKAVRNSRKDCRSFHSENQYTSKISTFPTIAPLSHQNLPDALAQFQRNA